MSSQKVMDMTKGPVLSQMTRFALPVLLGMLCQRIYNFADTYIVGRFLGDEALAAVSIAGTAMFPVLRRPRGTERPPYLRGRSLGGGRHNTSYYCGRHADSESAPQAP